MRARFELTRLEGQFFDTAKAIDKLARSRKALSTAHAEMGNKLINVATTEVHAPLGNALRKMGRVWHSLGDLDQAQAISECVILGDSLGYQGLNAKSAKETLLQRAGVLEEHQAAVKNTIAKKRQIERLKASSNIRPERVDEALEDLEEVSGLACHHPPCGRNFAKPSPSAPDALTPCARRYSSRADRTREVCPGV